MNDENTSIVTKIKTNYDYSESNSDGVKKPLSSITNFDQKINTNNNDIHSTCQFRTDKKWLECQYHDIDCTSIKKPDEVENEMIDPLTNYDQHILDRIQGSMFGMALGDALGAHVEFRPREYLKQNPVNDLIGGGTWGLSKGQFTDDTSMALCLANSLIARRDFVPYDQLVRYKWWYKNGYMSSTGQCFDIGAATSDSINEFIRRQKQFSITNQIPFEQLDYLSDKNLIKTFNVDCSEEGVAGNGALMRLAPVPLFFYKYPIQAIEYSGISGKITHGDTKAYDACRYYAALIVATLHGEKKEEILDKDFYSKHLQWFNNEELHPDIMAIAQGSYQRINGYDDGIRGKGYIVQALEAALWAFWSDDDSFKNGVLAAVNLGDDTDTTAAIYGQLAGAYYGYQQLPIEWVQYIYAKKFVETISKWIAYEGNLWTPITNILPFPSINSTNGSSANISQESKIPIDNSSTLDKLTKTKYLDNDIYLSKNMATWTTNDVCQWIESFGINYEIYAKYFKNDYIDGYRLFYFINDSALINYGITNQEHRQFILNQIEKAKLDHQSVRWS